MIVLTTHLAQARRGVAALEFAILAPVLILFSIGVFDISRAMIVQEQVWTAAHTIPLSASSLAVQPDRTTSLTVAQVQQALSGIFAAMPWLRSGALTGSTYAVMSSVNFELVNAGCVNTATKVCATTARIAWSVPYSGRGLSNFMTTVTRPCTVPAAVAEVTSAAVSLVSLPVSGIVTTIASPAPMLVVDVYYQFTPMFFGVLSGPINFWATGYWPIRSADPSVAATNQWTRYDITNQARGAGKCSGYP